MDTPSVVLAIVLIETAVGGLALTWFAPTWGAVRHGYELLLGGTVVGLLWGGYAAIGTPLDVLRDDPVAGGATAGDVATVVTRADQLETVLLAALVAGAVSLVALAAKLPLVARVVGGASTVAAVASFVPLAQLQTLLNDGGFGIALAELLLGSALLGGIWAGMILGHWYLVERRLSNSYMVWMSWANVVAVVAGVGAVLLSLQNPPPDSLFFSPLLSIDTFSITLGLGTIALLAVIAGFNVKLANEGGRSIQASTGMFYLAVIIAPAAEFAAKVRFF